MTVVCFSVFVVCIISKILRCVYDFRCYEKREGPHISLVHCFMDVVSCRSRNSCRVG